MKRGSRSGGTKRGREAKSPERPPPENGDAGLKKLAVATGSGAGAGGGSGAPRVGSPTLSAAPGSPLPPCTLTIDGESMTPESLMRVSVSISDDVPRVVCLVSDEGWRRIEAGRKVISDALASGKVVYGVNTGFGSFQNVVLPPDKLEELQVNLIRSHAAGVGPPLSLDRTRRLLALRINVLAKGHSGVRPETVEKMLSFLNSNCLPLVPEQGSVGASGDLAPLSHLALGMMGEGQMWDPSAQKYDDAAAVIKAHGLSAISLAAKEGLALINGTQFITALTAEAVARAERLSATADIIAAVTMEAVRATPSPFEHRVHEARGQDGQMESAERLRNVLHSKHQPSEIFLGYEHSVQDAYSLRCVPQVHGIVHDTIKFVKNIISRELNAATDNPMVFSSDGAVISAGNFHGEYPAKAADYLAMGVSELASISERRLERLVNHHLSGPKLKPDEKGNPRSMGLPHFLVKEGGLNSGFMIAHCTAAALVSENKTLVHPASCDSIPTSAAQEDHVSMGAYAARKALQVVENVERVLAIELLAAVQGLEFLRPKKSTASIERVVALLRGRVPFMESDAFMQPMILAAHDLVRSGDILRAVDPSKAPRVKPPEGAHPLSAAAIKRSSSRALLSGSGDADGLRADGAGIDGATIVAGNGIFAASAAAGAGGPTPVALEPYKEDRAIVSEMFGPLAELTAGLPLDPMPPLLPLDPSVPHAPKRHANLSPEETRLALSNALRYIPTEYHAALAPEFLAELKEYGHIYAYRFRPTSYDMQAYPIHCYPARCRQAAAIMLMITNNLDPKVAQFPHELITYGGNGSVFSNWIQYRVVMKYLSEMTSKQTLVLYSGHPLGLFPSNEDAPRVVVTNGMTVFNYSKPEDYDRMYALGVSQFGQMTAGSYCYIGPQGIVHGTTLTLLNAARRYLGSSVMTGKVFVSAGLGGMSGAQPKAGVICGCIAVVAEVHYPALKKRHEQGWVQVMSADVNEVIELIKKARTEMDPAGLSVGYHGNVVTLWEALAKEEELLVELGSDQTSLHNPYGGGYYPVQISFEESQEVMVKDPERFKTLVQDSLRRQVTAINSLCQRGMKFWDYGNSFLLEASRADADILDTKHPVKADGGPRFRYPSYVEDIMGDLFGLGFGPFRWVCTSGLLEDLKVTDEIAAAVTARLRDACEGETAVRCRQNYEDNHKWIIEAGKHELVVGSAARILYSDAEGRKEIALAFNRAVRDGRLTAPVVLSRDHHDVSGTDSPFRETTSINDGSRFCADMAIQNVIGDSFRGATWVSIHNGGGTGWGEAVNGGFGLVLDGTLKADRRAAAMLHWDVYNGIARRAWSGNDNARFAISREEKANPDVSFTHRHEVDPALLDTVVGAPSST